MDVLFKNWILHPLTYETQYLFKTSALLKMKFVFRRLLIYSKSYIGETGRSLRKLQKSLLKKSAVAKRALTYDHRMNWSEPTT